MTTTTLPPTHTSFLDDALAALAEGATPEVLPLAGDPSAATTEQGTVVTPVPTERLRAAKKAYTTRHLAAHLDDSDGDFTLVSGEDVTPRAGQVVLARVAAFGHHKKLPDVHGRRQTLYPDDEVLLAYAPRYAPDQFEAEVPGSLAMTNLAAAGGLAADVVTQHGSTNDPTVIEPLGLVADAGGTPLQLTDVAPFSVTPAAHTPATDAPGATTEPPVVYVLGSSMNAGKTTAVAQIVRGLSLAGLRVAAGKATGTGAWGDPGLFHDSGAETVLDFTDFGHGSTFRMDLPEIEQLVGAVRRELVATAPDVVVVEIADGLYQRETSHLVRSGLLGRDTHRVVLTVGEALGAVAGVAELRKHGLPLAGVTGAITASPLATQEAGEVLDLPLLDTYALAEPAVVRSFLAL